MTRTDPRVVLALAVVAVLLGAVVAWLSELSWASPGPHAPPAASGPGAADVAQLLEEARRITREATP